MGISDLLACCIHCISAGIVSFRPSCCHLLFLLILSLHRPFPISRHRACRRCAPSLDIRCLDCRLPIFAFRRSCRAYETLNNIILALPFACRLLRKEGPLAVPNSNLLCSIWSHQHSTGRAISFDSEGTANGASCSNALFFLCDPHASHLPSVSRATRRKARQRALAAR